MREPNELPISVEVLEKMLAEGGTRMLSVKPGPAAEARIIGVRWEISNGVPLVVLVYDRPIKEPALTLQTGLEQELTELRDEARRLAVEASRG